MALAWSLRFGFAIILINVTAASDNGDDFSNNLFSDLAPYVLQDRELQESMLNDV